MLTESWKSYHVGVSDEREEARFFHGRSVSAGLLGEGLLESSWNFCERPSTALLWSGAREFMESGMETAQKCECTNEMRGWRHRERAARSAWLEGRIRRHWRPYRERESRMPMDTDNLMACIGEKSRNRKVHGWRLHSIQPRNACSAMIIQPCGPGKGGRRCDSRRGRMKRKLQGESARIPSRTKRFPRRINKTKRPSPRVGGVLDDLSNGDLTIRQISRCGGIVSISGTGQRELVALGSPQPETPRLLASHWSQVPGTRVVLRW